MALSEDLIREELKQVIDPELMVNIVDLGLIYDVRLEEVDCGQTTCSMPSRLVGEEGGDSGATCGRSDRFVFSRTGDASRRDAMAGV